MASSYLAQQRAPMFAELAQKPWLLTWLSSLADHEMSGNPLPVLEALFNRAAMTGKSIEQLSSARNGFYGPVNRGNVQAAIQAGLPRKIINDTKDALDQIKAGSNVTQGATDQGMRNEIQGPFAIQVGGPSGDWFGDLGQGAAAWRQEQQAAAAKGGPGPTTTGAATPATAPASTTAVPPPGPSTPSPSSTAAPATGPPGLYARGGVLPSDLPGRSLAGVSPVLREMLGGAKAEFEKANPGYTIVATSGARPGGPSSSQHAGGNAIDMQIVGPNGQAIPNTGNDPSGLYHQYARYVYSEQQASHPELNGKLAWGGAFGTELGGGGAPDLMHFDLGGERGHWTMNRPSQLGTLPLQLAGATGMANEIKPSGGGYGPPVPPGNIVQNGQMYQPAGRAPPLMGGKGGGMYIPILSELTGIGLGRKGGGMYASQAGQPGAALPSTSTIPTGPALQVGPTASKGPFQPQVTAAPTKGLPANWPTSPLSAPVPPYKPGQGGVSPTGPIAPVPNYPDTSMRSPLYRPGPTPTTQPQLPASLQAQPQPPPGPVSPLRIQPGTGAQQPPPSGPSATVAGIPLSTPPATAPPSSPATPATAPPAHPSPYAPGGAYANPYNPGGIATPEQLAARGIPSPATPGQPPSLLGQGMQPPPSTLRSPALMSLLNAVNPVSSANAAPGPSAAAAVAATRGQVPIPRPNPIAGTQTGLTIPPRGPWPARPLANVPLPRSAPGQAPPPLPQNLGGTQMPPGAGPGVRMLDAVPPDYVPPNSADADPASQNFNNSLRAMGITPPVLGDNTLKFNPDYARAIGMSEDEIRRRMQQPPGPQGQSGSFAERFAGAPGQAGMGQYADPALAAALARYQGSGYPQSAAQGGPVPVGPGASQPPTPEQMRLDQLHSSPASGPVPTSSGDAGAAAAASTQDAVNAAIMEFMRKQGLSSYTGS